MEIWLATTNTGKIREIERLLSPQGVQIKTLKDLPTYHSPPETGKTFLENARIKAKSLKAVRNMDWVLAEDSGLEVEGLGGMPGVHSARYAGENAKDTENVLRVLKMLTLKAVTNRKCRFVCQMVLISPDQKEMTFEGFLTGEISKQPKGTDGFGYDPIFIPEGETKTLAELGLAFKNKVSHRARATEKLIEALFPPK